MVTSDKEDDDRSLFRKAIDGARPLKQDSVNPHRTRRKPVPQQRQRDEKAVVASLLSDDYCPDIETGEELRPVAGPTASANGLSAL